MIMWHEHDLIDRLNATDFLVRLRGKRLLLVGDSMNRNQFESLLCVLREALPDKSKMYETRGYRITKGRGYFIFKFVVTYPSSIFGTFSFCMYLSYLTSFTISSNIIFTAYTLQITNS